MALPKRNRLRSRQDFQAVFRGGIRRSGSCLTLRALRPKSDASEEVGAAGNQSLAASKVPSQVQIGISISTKVSKRANVRNRIKRQIRAACRTLLPKLSPGWRLVIVVHPLAGESKCVSHQFLQELEQLLADAEVLYGHS